MSTDKQAEKKALLHELESIKSLLLEEMDSMAEQELAPLNILAETEAKANITPPPILDDAYENFDIPLLEPENAITANAHLNIPLLEVSLEPELHTNTAEGASPRHLGEEKMSQHHLFDQSPNQDTPKDTSGNAPDCTPDPTPDLTPSNAPPHNASPHNAPQHNESTKYNKTQNVASAQRVTASGENPFLPQYIRDRLHGNRMAMEEAKAQYSQSRSPQEHKIQEPHAQENQTPTHSIDREKTDQLSPNQVLDQLIAEFIPQIEAKLRLQLQPILDQQLQQHSPQERQTAASNTNHSASE